MNEKKKGEKEKTTEKVSKKPKQAKKDEIFKEKKETPKSPKKRFSFFPS